MLPHGAAPAIESPSDRPARSAPGGGPSVEFRHLPTKMRGWVHYQVWIDGQFVHTGWTRADYWSEDDTAAAADIYALRNRPTSRADAKAITPPLGLHLVR